MKKSLRSLLSHLLVTVFTMLLIFQSPGLAASVLKPSDLSEVFLPAVSNSYEHEAPVGYSTIQGVITDVRTNQPVDGAHVCVNISQICEDSNIDGEYQLEEVPAGKHNLTIRHTSYESFDTVVFLSPDVPVTLDVDLLPILLEGQWRISVTWDPTPTWPPDDYENDLNLHLWIKDYDPADVHIYEGDLGNCNDLEAAPGACYEHEERRGSGPDVIVITEDTDYVYAFSVLNYNAAHIGVPPITDLDVLVKIFDSSGLRAEYNLDDLQGQSGDFWYIFDINDNLIVSQHCLLQYVQTGDQAPACP